MCLKHTHTHTIHPDQKWWSNKKTDLIQDFFFLFIEIFLGKFLENLFLNIANLFVLFVCCFYFLVLICLLIWFNFCFIYLISLSHSLSLSPGPFNFWIVGHGIWFHICRPLNEDCFFYVNIQFIYRRENGIKQENSIPTKHTHTHTRQPNPMIQIFDEWKYFLFH